MRRRRMDVPLLADTVGMEKNRTEKVHAEEERDAESEKERTERGSSVRAARPVAIVVGASSGIGLEVACALTLKGYTVINVSRRVCENGRVKNITADIAQGEELEHALQEAGREHGEIALLVYSAGCSLAAPLEFAKEADIRYLFEINYFGAVRAVRSVLPFMKKQGGGIFLISSLGGTFPVPFDSFYSSSKAALDMLVRCVRTELRRYKITLTAVQPGGTSTSFTFKRKVYADEENGEYAKDVHKAVAALGNIEQGGMEPRAVAEEIVSQILKKDPSITFATGGKNKAYRLMERMLPEKWTEYWNNKKYNQ